MVKSTELKSFYQISWKIKGITAVFNQLKLEISKVWSGIPYLSRKKLGIERVNNTFESINALIRSTLNDLGSISYQYNKIYRNVILMLQNAGVFINSSWTEDILKIRIEEGNVITEVAEEVIKNISTSLNISSDIDKGIDNPNIIDLFAINKSRVKIAEAIVDGCKNYFNEILKTTSESDSRATNEESEIIRQNVDHINSNFDDLKRCFEILNNYFDEITNEIINTLKSAYIEVEVTSSREEEINRVIGYYDIADVYRMIRGSLKYEKAFNRLLENKKNAESLTSEAKSNNEQTNNQDSSSEQKIETISEETTIEISPEKIVVEK